MAVQLNASDESLGGNITFTVPVTDNLLVYILARGRTGAGTGATPTFNSVNMTNKIKFDEAGGDATVEVWYMLNPPTGSAYTLGTGTTAGTSAYDGAIVFSVSGADTSGDPFSACDTYSDNFDTDLGTQTQTVTSSAGELVIDAVATFRAGTPTVSESGQTVVENGANYGVSQKNGDTSVTVGWDGTSALTDATAWVVMSIKASEGTVIVPAGTITFVGVAPLIATAVHKVVPVGEITFVGVAPTRRDAIHISTGKIYFGGEIPLVGDEDLHIRSSDGITLVGTINAGDAVMLVSKGDQWYAFAMPKV